MKPALALPFSPLLTVKNHFSNSVSGFKGAYHCQNSFIRIWSIEDSRQLLLINYKCSPSGTIHIFFG